MFFRNQHSKSYLFDILNLENIMGMNKKQVINKLGLHFNDINANIWMYRIENLTNKVHSIKYLYLLFNNDILTEVKFSRVKKKLIYKLLKKNK